MNTTAKKPTVAALQRKIERLQAEVESLRTCRQDAWRYRVMVENGVVPTQWHEIISEQREGFRARADAAFDDFVSEELSDYEYGEHAPNVAIKRLP